MDWILQLDGEILVWIQNNIRQEFLNPIIMFVTSLGNAGWFWLVLLAVMLLFPKYRKTGLAGLVAVLIGFLITNLWLKNMVARTRPYELVEGLSLLGARANDFSFPSGHSTCSMAAAVVLFARLPRKQGIWALALGMLICVSRLYIGIHYPTDVFAGMLIGTMSACVAMRVIKQEKGAVGIDSPF